MKFTKSQKEVIESSTALLTPALFQEIIEQQNVETLTDSDLVEFLQLANHLYRSGEPALTDDDYDHIFRAELEKRQPNHPFLHEVEPEVESETKTVKLPTRMLSTDKAYDFQTIERWAKRIEKTAIELKKDFSRLEFRITPKLDGYAAYDDGTSLYTRGDGWRGTDITRAFERGLQVAVNGERGLGAGEIVVSKSWFAERLADTFENSRNIQAALIKEKELDSLSKETLQNGKAVFFPFRLLPDWRGNWGELSKDFTSIVDNLWYKLDYDIDGVVLEITDAEIQQQMGATRHHHRWQIAYKRNTETVEVEIERVIPQTSRSGRVNPVAEFAPTRLRGAMIRRATAHHYAMVQEQGIGVGAVIRLSRSGEVIPKIEEVIRAGTIQLPTICPSCSEQLVWDGDWLICTNHLHCSAQVVHSLEHFFKTLGNIDGFGPSSLQKIYDGNIRSIDAIYELNEGAFQRLGFGPKQAENMVLQLARSLKEPIEEWRFLAAFGIHRMGMGNCEKLLSCYSLERIFTLTHEEIAAIYGFSDKTAQEIRTGLATINREFWQLHSRGFLLIETTRAHDNTDTLSPLVGKTVVFTGTMQKGSRNEMQKEAKALGAIVGSSVSSKTDFLVCGAKVGKAKIVKAEKLGVQCISEEEYFIMIAQ